MQKRHHVVFTGTGRAGTTFIISVLTKLGLDTGFSEEGLEKGIDKNGRAGLEGNIRLPDAPYIVKSPNMSNYIEEVVANPEIVLDHVFIPVRDIVAAAQSRVFVSEAAISKEPFLKRLFASKRGYAGGMTKTSNAEKQQVILLKTLSNLLVGISASSAPVTLIHYPKLVKDPAYLYAKIKPILKDIPFHDFKKVYLETLKPEWVHQFSDQDQ